MKNLLIELKSFDGKELFVFLNQQEDNNITREGKYLSALKYVLKLINLSNQFKLAENEYKKDEIINKIVPSIRFFLEVAENFFDGNKRKIENTLESFNFLFKLLKVADAYFFGDHLYAHITLSLLSNYKFIKMFEHYELEPFIMEFYDETRLSQSRLIQPYSSREEIPISNNMLNHIITYSNHRINRRLPFDIIKQRYDADFLIEQFKEAEKTLNYKIMTISYRVLKDSEALRNFYVSPDSVIDFKGEFELINHIEKGGYFIDKFVDSLLEEELEELHSVNELFFTAWHPKLHKVIELSFQRAIGNSDYSEDTDFFDNLLHLIQLSNPSEAVPEFNFGYTVGSLRLGLLEKYFKQDSIYEYLCEIGDFHLFDKVNKKYKKLFTDKEKTEYKRFITSIKKNKGSMSFEKLLITYKSVSHFEFVATIETLFNNKDTDNLSYVVSLLKDLSKYNTISLLAEKFEQSFIIENKFKLNRNHISRILPSVLKIISEENEDYLKYIAEYMILSMYVFLQRECSLDYFSEQTSRVFSKYLSEEDYIYLKGKFSEEQLVLVIPKEG